MHGSSLIRMEWFVDNFIKPSGKMSVLDIGSCDVAGGTYKQFFPASRFTYTGLDMSPGPNVDIVPEYPYHWCEIPDDSYDVVISGQALEHMEFFWQAVAEMARVLKPGGMLCIIAPRGFERHRYPVDCYRFDADGMAALTKWCNLELLHASTDMQPSGGSPEWHIEACEDSMLVARKPEQWAGMLDLREYKYAATDELPNNGFIPCPSLPAPSTILLSAHEEIVKKHEREMESMQEEMLLFKRRVEEYENSNSWRLTRPLRMLGRLARQLIGIKKTLP